MVMHFAVIREQGPGWDAARTMREQNQWPQHVDYINGIAADGFLLMAGPLGDGNPYQALLIVDAENADRARIQLDEDPWTTVGVLTTKSVDRWEVLVGEFVTD